MATKCGAKAKSEREKERKRATTTNKREKEEGETPLPGPVTFAKIFAPSFRLVAPRVVISRSRVGARTNGRAGWQ